MANKTKVTRKGAGRTKGSYSFVSIPLKDLTAKFADVNQPIIVGRKFAQSVGLQAVSQPATDLVTAIQGKTPETAVATTAVEL